MISVGFYGDSIYMNPVYSATPVQRVKKVSDVETRNKQPEQVEESNVKKNLKTFQNQSMAESNAMEVTVKDTYDENNPYDQARKVIEGSFLAGQNVDLSA